MVQYYGGLKEFGHGLGLYGPDSDLTFDEDDSFNYPNSLLGPYPSQIGIGQQLLGGSNPYMGTATSSFRAAPSFSSYLGAPVASFPDLFPQSPITGNIIEAALAPYQQQGWETQGNQMVSNMMANSPTVAALAAQPEHDLTDPAAKALAAANLGFGLQPGQDPGAQALDSLRDITKHGLATIGLRGTIPDTIARSGPRALGLDRGITGFWEDHLSKTGKEQDEATHTFANQVMNDTIKSMELTDPNATSQEVKSQAMKNFQNYLTQDIEFRQQPMLEEMSPFQYGINYAGTGVTPADIESSPTGWAPGQALIDMYGNKVTLSNDPQSVAAANYRSFMSNQNINVANTIAEALARADEAIAGMGLTGAAKDKASALASAEMGYLSPAQLAGLQAEQQEQDRAVAAAAAAMAAASRSSGGDSGGDDESDPEDTMAGFGTVSDAEVEAVMAQIVADALEAEDPMSSRYGAHYGGGEEGYGGGFGAPGGSGGGGGYEV